MIKILVAYDGSLSAKTALRCGIRKAQKDCARLIVLNVFNRDLFLDYDAVPWAEELSRNEFARLASEARKILREEAEDVCSTVVDAEGNPEEEISEYATEYRIGMIFLPKRYSSIEDRVACPVCLIQPETEDTATVGRSVYKYV